MARRLGLGAVAPRTPRGHQPFPRQSAGRDSEDESEDESAYMRRCRDIDEYHAFIADFNAALRADSKRQDDIINALPDLHDINGNTIPKMDEYGDYDERYLRIARTMPGFQRSRA